LFAKNFEKIFGEISLASLWRNVPIFMAENLEFL